MVLSLCSVKLNHVFYKLAHHELSHMHELTLYIVGDRIKHISYSSSLTLSYWNTQVKKVMEVLSTSHCIVKRYMINQGGIF